MIPMNEKRREEIKHLVEQGWYRNKIAKHLGVSYQTVRYYTDILKLDVTVSPSYRPQKVVEGVTVRHTIESAKSAPKAASPPPTRKRLIAGEGFKLGPTKNGVVQYSWTDPSLSKEESRRLFDTYYNRLPSTPEPAAEAEKEAPAVLPEPQEMEPVCYMCRSPLGPDRVECVVEVRDEAGKRVCDAMRPVCFACKEKHGLVDEDELLA